MSEGMGRAVRPSRARHWASLQCYMGMGTRRNSGKGLVHGTFPAVQGRTPWGLSTTADLHFYKRKEKETTGKMK